MYVLCCVHFWKFGIVLGLCSASKLHVLCILSFGMWCFVCLQNDGGGCCVYSMWVSGYFFVVFDTLVSVSVLSVEDQCPSVIISL